MFNKLKEIGTKLGNKKQRAKYSEQAKGDMDFVIALYKLELQHSRTLLPFIKSSTDHNEYPTFIKREVFQRPADMTEQVREEKIKFLKDAGWKTIFSENTVVRFDKIEDKTEDKK